MGVGWERRVWESDQETDLGRGGGPRDGLRYLSQSPGHRTDCNGDRHRDKEKAPAQTKPEF